MNPYRGNTACRGRLRGRSPRTVRADGQRGRTVRADGPRGRSARTVRADGPHGRSARTARADGPCGRSALTVRADRVRRWSARTVPAGAQNKYFVCFPAPISKLLLRPSFPNQAMGGGRFFPTTFIFGVFFSSSLRMPQQSRIVRKWISPAASGNCCDSPLTNTFYTEGHDSNSSKPDFTYLV